MNDNVQVRIGIENKKKIDKVIRKMTEMFSGIKQRIVIKKIRGCFFDLIVVSYEFFFDIIL